MRRTPPETPPSPNRIETLEATFDQIVHTYDTCARRVLLQESEDSNHKTAIVQATQEHGVIQIVCPDAPSNLHQHLEIGGNYNRQANWRQYKSRDVGDGSPLRVGFFDSQDYGNGDISIVVPSPDYSGPGITLTPIAETVTQLRTLATGETIKAQLFHLLRGILHRGENTQYESASMSLQRALKRIPDVKLQEPVTTSTANSIDRLLDGLRYMPEAFIGELLKTLTQSRNTRELPFAPSNQQGAPTIYAWDNHQYAFHLPPHNAETTGSLILIPGGKFYPENDLAKQGGL